MVHSIASLVNPHAKLAEAEAKRAEQEYYQNQSQNASVSRQSVRSGTRLNVPLSSRGKPYLVAHIISSPEQKSHKVSL